MFSRRAADTRRKVRQAGRREEEAARESALGDGQPAQAAWLTVDDAGLHPYVRRNVLLLLPLLLRLPLTPRLLTTPPLTTLLPRRPTRRRR